MGSSGTEFNGFLEDFMGCCCLFFFFWDIYFGFSGRHLQGFKPMIGSFLGCVGDEKDYCFLKKIQMVLAWTFRGDHRFGWSIFRVGFIDTARFDWTLIPGWSDVSHCGDLKYLLKKKSFLFDYCWFPDLLFEPFTIKRWGHRSDAWVKFLSNF